MSTYFKLYLNLFRFCLKDVLIGLHSFETVETFESKFWILPSKMISSTWFTIGKVSAYRFDIWIIVNTAIGQESKEDIILSNLTMSWN